MLVYRSFVVGMLGAIALLVATLPGELAARLDVTSVAADAPGPRSSLAVVPAEAPAIAYVRPELALWHPETADLVARVAWIAPGEVIASVDGAPGPGRYLEVRLAGPRGTRTVLLLFTR